MDGAPHWDCHILGSLLQLRGSTPSASPLVDVRGNVLAFSGELFAGVAVGSGAENDAAALLATFDEVFARAPDDEGLAASALVARLRGPWALAYWHEASKRLWFGRDVFGRRSLLLRRAEGLAGDARRGASPRATGLVLSSVAPDCGQGGPDVSEKDDWEELEPGLYSVDARAAGKENGAFSLPSLTRAPAPPRDAGALGERLRRFRRARAATRPAVERAKTSSLGAAKEPRAFARGETEDARGAADDERALFDARDARDVFNTARDAAVDGFLAALSAAVERRVALSVVDVDVAIRSAEEDQDTDAAAFVGVLFSGGVDSMLLAALAHRHAPPGRAVDLINVCFDSGRSPDRAAALDGVAELEALFPARAWRLVRVDADVDEVHAVASRLAALLRPARTVMDRNIGAALWLAARGEGWVEAEAPRRLAETRGDAPVRVRVPYASRARVLLLGQGADEQCAGYSRHRDAFRRGGGGGETGRDWEALRDAVRLDVRRLWRRNMGRDDRLVSDRGREARFPFLDEGVAARLLATPLCDVADLAETAGAGDKLLIRAAARRLGMRRAAARAKRAIQFGSRVSKRFDASARGSLGRAARGAGDSVLPSGGCAPDAYERDLHV